MQGGRDPLYSTLGEELESSVAVKGGSKPRKKLAHQGDVETVKPSEGPVMEATKTILDTKVEALSKATSTKVPR